MSPLEVEMQNDVPASNVTEPEPADSALLSMFQPVMAHPHLRRLATVLYV
ncbi:hypothetical protein [Arthrobacter psychrolactophilus]|nr:hypothetical protein [Arthrobacter psychrolactophilus]